jgi:hypothetical protein
MTVFRNSWIINEADTSGFERVLAAGDTLKLIPGTSVSGTVTTYTVKVTTKTKHDRSFWGKCVLLRRGRETRRISIDTLMADMKLTFPIIHWPNAPNHDQPVFRQIAARFRDEYRTDRFERLEGDILIDGKIEEVTLWQVDRCISGNKLGAEILILDVAKEPEALSRALFFQGGIAHGEPG